MGSLSNRILRALWYRVMSPFLWIRFHIKLVIKFIFPNLRKIIRKKVTYVDYPVCNQKLLITGEGSVQFGANCKFGYKLGGNYSRGLIELQSRYSQSKIIFGNHVTTNNNLVICAANLVEIGDDTLIGQGVSIMDHEAHCIDPAKRRQLGKIGKVIIGRNVWIGNNVIILKNSEIGLNSIVAAGAVVAGKFPSNVIIGGVPSKVIKEL